MPQTIVTVEGASLKLGSQPAELEGGNTSSLKLAFEANVEEVPTFGSYPDSIPVATKKSCTISGEFYASGAADPLVAGDTTAFALTSDALNMSGSMVLSKIEYDLDAGSGPVKGTLEGKVAPGYTLAKPTA